MYKYLEMVLVSNSWYLNYIVRSMISSVYALCCKTAKGAMQQTILVSMFPYQNFTAPTIVDVNSHSQHAYKSAQHFTLLLSKT